MTSPPDRRRCSATSQQSGERCRNRPIKGGAVCRFHGGAAPQVRAAARLRLVEQSAALTLAEWEVPTLSDDPLGALLEHVDRMAALEALLRAKVAELGDGALTSMDALGHEQLPVLFLAWERAIDRTHRAWVDLVKLGIEERLARVNQAQAVSIGAAFDRALSTAGIEEDQQDAARKALAAEIRKLGA